MKKISLFEVAYKNLLRKRARSILTILGIAMAAWVLVSLFGFNRGYEASLNKDIDNLGFLLADISRLTKQADDIKTRIKAEGLDFVDGVVFRATVVKQERTSYDPRKVEIMLGDKISMVEKVTAVTSVKLVALPSF
jgi:ABC-type antimicrobial peptide transport system permease subunit